MFKKLTKKKNPTPFLSENNRQAAGAARERVEEGSGGEEGEGSGGSEGEGGGSGGSEGEGGAAGARISAC